MLGEVVVVLDPDAAPGVDYVRKPSMQLASKMRFISVQFDALLCSAPTCGCAARPTPTRWRARLESAVRGVEGLTLRRPVQANSVFAVLPAAVTARLQKRFRFYTWDDATGEVRWMTTFDTTEDDVDVFAAAIHEELASTPRPCSRRQTVRTPSAVRCISP